MNLFRIRSDRKKRSIAGPITLSQSVITFIMLLVMVLSLSFFINIRVSFLNFSEQAVRGIKNSSDLAGEVKQLLTDTERLMSANSNPERRLAYENIIKSSGKISEIQERKKFNDRNVKKHIEIINSTLEELNSLVEEKIKYNSLSLKRMDELMQFLEDYQEFEGRKEWDRAFFENNTFKNTLDWYYKISSITRQAGSIFRMNILSDINETERNMMADLDELESNLYIFPASDRIFYESNLGNLKKIILGENGLINLVKEKTKISLKTTGRGNFTRTLLNDFIYISSNIFNRVIEYSELEIDKLTQMINRFYYFFLLLLLATITVSTGMVLYVRKKLIKRLLRLNDEILEKVAGFDISITVEGNDELSDMAKSFLFYENEVKQREEELNRIASQDFLTEISNRRHFMELAEKEIARGKRYGFPVTLLMLDIDYFKKINDSYGHHSGDIVLKEFTMLCNSIIRENDIFGRVGGEEFAMILPETNLEGGVVFAERLREAVEQSSWEINSATVKITVSIGAAECSCSGETLLDNVMKKADSALYRAKKEGRNKTCY